MSNIFITEQRYVRCTLYYVFLTGQFGVGFYSTFMVAEKVEVFSQSSSPDEVAHHWVSDGSGQYEITEAEGVQRG